MSGRTMRAPTGLVDSTTPTRVLVQIDKYEQQRALVSRTFPAKVSSRSPHVRLYVRGDLPLEEVLATLDEMRAELARIKNR